MTEATIGIVRHEPNEDVVSVLEDEARPCSASRREGHRDRGDRGVASTEDVLGCSSALLVASFHEGPGSTPRGAVASVIVRCDP
jgi:hypothetical protein